MNKEEKFPFPIIFLAIFLATTGVKILLIPSYHSTDFEVHRNWLAITYNLPINKWYYENTSIWTLDYPPLFAWFECGLSQLAARVDSEIVQIDNLNYEAPSVVFFQRLSVISSEFVFVLAVFAFGKHLGASQSTLACSCALLSLCSPGLFIVDHIHFQYNGLLFGILAWSILAFQAGWYLTSAFFFAALLNFKHIFLYCAPAYTLALFKYCCFSDISTNGRVNLRSFQFSKFISLAVVTLSVFAASLGPFVFHLPQLLSRLFPFQRGLMHAYWAPNVWALYAMADKIVVIFGQKVLGMTFNSSNIGAMTGGLVKEQNFVALPQITPQVTLVLTILFTLPGLALFWLRSTNRLDIARLVVYSSLISFYFGWHVHEKAICMVLIPFGLFFAISRCEQEFRSFTMISVAGYYSLFPLLFTGAEYFIKLLLFIIYLIIIHFVAEVNNINKPFLGGWLCESVILAVFSGIEGFPFGFSTIHQRYPFLQLMMTSVFCSILIAMGSITFFLSMINVISNSGVKSASKIKKID